MLNKTLSEFLAEAKAILKEQRERGRPEFPTGIGFLDNLTNGIRRGEIWIISGKTGSGKTSLALQMARSFADDPKHTILFLSLEMRGWELILRMFCEMNSVSYFELISGAMEPPDDLLKLFNDYVSKIDFEVVEGGYDFKEVEGVIKEYYTSKHPDIIFLDFIQLIEWKQYGDERVALMEYIRKIKELANKTNIAFVVVSQIRRLPSGADYNRPPDLSDLKGCIGGSSIVNGKKIEDIYKNQDFHSVKSYDLEKKSVVYIKPQKIINTGRLRCYWVKTKLGKEIVLSEATKLFNGKWIMAKDLKKGDKIYVNQNIAWNKGLKGYKNGGSFKKEMHVSPKTEFKKGQIAWNKGFCHLSEETKEKISQLKRGKKLSFEHKKRILEGRKKNPYIPTPEHRKRVGDALRSKNGRKICSDGYAYIYRPFYKNSFKGKTNNGYILEHKFILEQHLGRDILHTEQIHHLNGIKSDNKLENLILCRNVQAHNEIHNKMEKFVFDLIREGRVIYGKEKFIFR